MAAYTFKAAPWSRSVWLATIVFTATLLIAFVVCLSMGISALPMSRVMAGLVLGLGLVGPLIVAVAAALSPRAYVVDRERITVLRVLGQVRLALDNIDELTVADGKHAFGGSRRAFASGGAFGYYGQFHSQQLKTFTAYVTSLDKVVVIRQRKGGPVILSPDQPEQFVSCVENLRKGLPSGSGQHIKVTESFSGPRNPRLPLVVFL